MASTRRLAAIMFTDMVGSTAAAQNDETSALRAIETQAEILRPRFAAHQGREVKSLGDGFLVVFDSALRAVQCAIDVQQLMRERNSEPGIVPILLRIGIHLGDVEERANDIFGDSVNVASRIEPLASPGGICLTEPVFGQVRNKITNPLEKLEPRVLKNVRFPFDVYKVAMPWELGMGAPVPSRKHRVAVMPLVNMISDPSEEYFADGMTEELISAISKVRELDVISRTSVTQYKATTKKAIEIGRELNVGTLLEGSVRKAGNRVRIAVQLIDAESDKHVWAESYDRTLEDVFSIQSEIAQAVASMLKVTLLEGDRRRIERVPTEDPEAHVNYLKGKSADTYQAAISFYQRAIDKDPNFALAYAALANAHVQMGFAEEVPREDAAREAEKFVNRSLELDPLLGESHAILALVLFTRGDYVGVDRELDRALELEPNSTTALGHKSNYSRFKRHYDESARLARRALELDPLSLDMIQETAYHFVELNRPADAIPLLTKAVQIDPGAFWGQYWLGLAYVEEGRVEDGVALMREARSKMKQFWSGLAIDWAYALAKAGRVAELKELLAESLEFHDKNRRGALSLVAIYANLGEKERAFEWIEKALDERPYMLPTVFSDVPFESLWSDSRIRVLKNRMGWHGDLPSQTPPHS